MTDLERLDWESWDDPVPDAGSEVRWKLIFSGRCTATAAMSVGLAEIAPGGVVPTHHHAAVEFCHVIEGEGRAEVEGVAHELRAGVSLFIPADARHGTVNTGATPLRVLFMFPGASFENVTYYFDEAAASPRA